VIERYLHELAAELSSVGIRGAQRRRILVEVEDHLRESGEPGRFGDPALIAARFADELATSGARRLGFAVVAGLAPAALVYAVLFSFSRPGPDITSARTLPVGIAAALAMVLAPQVALAAGLLSAARAWHTGTGSSAASIGVLRRRIGVALGSGVVAIAAIAVYAYEYGAGLPGWQQTFVILAAGAAAVPVAAGSLALARTSQLRPQAPGPAGDVFDDLAPVIDRFPLGLRGHPWRFCLLFAGTIAAVVLIVGGPDEGPRNAVLEFAAACAGFAVFGRYLGLRPSRARH
jgi:hypothetical protein